MNKFEKLIEYVINDDEAKAKALFHNIVVEKSRKIYEGLMDEEEMGGDEVDSLVDDIEAEESGMTEDEDELEAPMDDAGEFDDESDEMMGDEFGDDEMDMDSEEDFSGEEELEDRVVDLEDKLDELMAEFDTLVDDDEVEMDMDSEEDFGDDEMDMDSEEDELDDMEEMKQYGLDENVELTKVSKGIANKSEEGSVNKKSIVAANSGAKGSSVKPVKPTGTEAKGGKNPTVKDEGSTTKPDFKKYNHKPKSSEEASTNKKSVVESRRARTARKSAAAKRSRK